MISSETQTSLTRSDVRHHGQLARVLSQIRDRQRILFPESMLLSVRLRLVELGYSVGETEFIPGGFSHTPVTKYT